MVCSAASHAQEVWEGICKTPKGALRVHRLLGDVSGIHDDIWRDVMIEFCIESWTRPTNSLDQKWLDIYPISAQLGDNSLPDSLPEHFAIKVFLRC